MFPGWFTVHQIVCYPVSMPKSTGIRMTFMLAGDDASDRSPALVRPERLIGLTFRMLAVLLLVCFFFQDPTDLDDRRALSITSGFTTAPYSYVFTPVWLLVICLTTVGVILTVLQQRLLDDKGNKTDQEKPLSTRVKVAAAVGGLWAFFEFLCLWIAIPQFQNSGYISCPAGLLAALWPVVAYDRKHGSSWIVERICKTPEGETASATTAQRTAMVQYGYVVMLLVCMVISALHTVGSILLMIALFGFEYAVPALPGLIVEFEALADHAPDKKKDGAAEPEAELDAGADPKMEAEPKASA
jgi:hypothetical protein